jgi:glycerophosphoryl diester phosphodiesterase
MGNIKRIGHRGASGYEPENTLRSFKKALELGVDMVELDVHVCKTGELIVMHNEKVNRTTNGKGKISKKTLSEIKELKISNKEKVPTLQEVVDLTKEKCRLNIEIKDKNAANKVLEIIAKNSIKSPIMVSSNYILPLQILAKKNPTVDRALIFWATKNPFRQKLFGFLCSLLFPVFHFFIFKRAKKARANWINLMYPLASKNFVKKAHFLHYKVAVWTVNKLHAIKKMRHRGVDAIISNFPDRL